MTNLHQLTLIDIEANDIDIHAYCIKCDKEWYLPWAAANGRDHTLDYLYINEEFYRVFN